jgi:hypothetical protein
MVAERRQVERRSSDGVRPSTRSASASPTAAECLKPWPEQADEIVSPAQPGGVSITKFPSVETV